MEISFEGRDSLLDTISFIGGTFLIKISVNLTRAPQNVTNRKVTCQLSGMKRSFVDKSYVLARGYHNNKFRRCRKTLVQFCARSQ